MSPVDPRIPAAGEEIHLPGLSPQPLLVAVGVTIALLGVTFHWIVVGLGLALTVWQTALWIRDARREIDELPLQH